MFFDRSKTPIERQKKAKCVDENVPKGNFLKGAELDAYKIINKINMKSQIF